MLLPRRQLNGLGADELHHPLRCTLQVQVESHRGVARDGPAREQLRCVGFQGGAPESLPPRGPGLGAHHLLRNRREVGLREQDHVHLPLGDRVPVHAQGRNVGLRHA